MGAEPLDPALASRRRPFWARLVLWAAELLRILWVCRVSVLNVVVSLLFFDVTVQAQNLMADLSSWDSWREYVFWAGVFGFTSLLWAFPVHYGARRSLDQLGHMAPGLKDDFRWFMRWLPRLLGLVPFVALWFAVRGARDSASGATGLLPAADQTMAQGTWLYVADGVAAALFFLLIVKRRRLIPATWTGSFLYPAAAIATAAIFATAYVAPIETSVLFPRALLIPPLFGSLVLGASWLTRLGDRTGFPFLATLALVLGVSTGLNAHFNDLRTLKTARVDQRLTVPDAVGLWKAANDCKTVCPSPIVIAIDGGASRAAFTAATFVGDFLDRMPLSGKQEAPTPGRRIFAISGVSGGAYGAAVIQAALVEAQSGGDGNVPPCRSAQKTWFGFQDWHERGNGFTWRQCLQALTSGDYLSSTIIGLAFRDFAAPPWQWVGLPAMADRAAILEMTWERQFAATLVSGLPFYEAGDVCADNDKAGLCRRMAHPADFVTKRGPPDTSPKLWMPMLLLNGTSVSTGRRIIASDLESAKAGTPSGPLYPQAFDLREAMSSPCRAGSSETGSTTTGVCGANPIGVDGPDVRLSTAALTSARFPVISPAGVFRMKGSGYGDQVVDGGYFENSGLTTALDIVHALEQSGLHPIVVSISNNPAYDVQDVVACRKRFGLSKDDATARLVPSQCTGLPPRPATTPLVAPADDSFLGRFFGLLYRPFQTLVASGDGHADELMALIDAHPPPGGFVHLLISVTPSFDPAPVPDGALPVADPECDALQGRRMTMAKVSMSWWLAAAVQADLDIQRCTWPNRVGLQKLLAKVTAAR